MPTDISLDASTQNQRTQQQIPDAEDATEYDELHVDDDLSTPSSRKNERPGRRTPKRQGAQDAVNKVKGVQKWRKSKGKLLLQNAEAGVCPLLDLPQDLLHLLLGRLPPRSLAALSATCTDLRAELEGDAIWRESYINRFIHDGASRSESLKRHVKVLVQSCVAGGLGGQGWRKEALEREKMLSRWIHSKAPQATHNPQIGRIDALSLSYEHFAPPQPRGLVVGKHHPATAASPSPPATPPSVAANASSSSVDAANSLSPTPKLTHRQKYELLLSQTTRPPPFVHTASLVCDAIVRSDPLSGKVSKGFWGPGRNANLHLRPNHDPSLFVSCLHIARHTQTHAVWGLETGSVVHTALHTRQHASQGGRASSVNTTCALEDAHEGPVVSIWEAEPPAEPPRWLTTGTDGRIKLWRLVPGQSVMKTKGKGDSTAAVDTESRIDCLWTSNPSTAPFEGRSDAVKRRQNGKPDEIVLARAQFEAGVVVGVTADGDLKVWYDAGGQAQREVRIDVGSEEENGPVDQMELDVRLSDGKAIVHVYVHQQRHSVLRCWDVDFGGTSEPTVTVRAYDGAQGRITALYTDFCPAAALSLPPTASPPAPGESPLIAVTPAPAHGSGFGRLIIAGDEHGSLYIWPVVTDPDTLSVQPICAMPSGFSSPVTSLAYSNSLLAAGSHNGHLNILDPLPLSENLIRSFRASSMHHAEQTDAELAELVPTVNTVRHLMLESDLVVASVCQRVFAWRPGQGKGKMAKLGEKRRVSGGKGESKGGQKNLDMKKLHRDAVADNEELGGGRPSRYQAQQSAALEHLGLEDADEAVQYALMLSMQEQGLGADQGEHAGEEVDNEQEEEQEEDEAVRAVREYEEGRERETREMIEMIRLAEAREAGCRGDSP